MSQTKQATQVVDRMNMEDPHWGCGLPIAISDHIARTHTLNLQKLPQNP
jgi:hypothetical protein